MDETYYSKFKIAVDYKWIIDRPIIISHAVIFGIYVIMIDCEILYNLEFRADSPNYKGNGLLYVIMLFSIVGILFEFLQIYIQRWDYIDFTNFLDLVG